MGFWPIIVGEIFDYNISIFGGSNGIELLDFGWIGLRENWYKMRFTIFSLISTI